MTVPKVECSVCCLCHGTEPQGRGEGALCALRQFSSQWTEEVGLEDQVLNQSIGAVVKEAIVVTLSPGQHRMGESGSRRLPGENHFNQQFNFLL